MDASTLQSYAQRIETDLRENILSFWMDRVVDRERGAFFGSLTNDLVVDRRAERGALLTCRILWTFAAAYRRFHDPAYLNMADRAYADLTTTFADRDHGGFYWSVADDGRVLRDRKQVYGQAFAIYALTEYHLASGLPAALHEAIAVHHLLERYARETSYGGYLEAFSRSWQPIADMRLSAVDLNEPKSQNTLLHVMEAYTNLLRAWPDEGLRAAQARLLETMLDHVLDPRTAHLGLFFTNDWTLRSDRISYGHDIEAAWLFTQAADVLGHASLTARIHPLAVRIAEVTLAEGLDADGGVYNEGSPRGLTDTNKEWWPAAEAVVGLLNAYQLGRQPAHLQAALQTWDFIEQRLIDRQHGEWFRGVTRDGRILAGQLKVSFWKCPYHNGRTGLEASARLRAIAAQL
jgi:mannobiose 2-epimerase